MKNLIKIKGDASSREFFRKQNKNNSSVLVFAKKEKFKNLIIYDAINKIFIKNRILAPILYNENYNKHFIEIQDFGNQTIFKLLSKKNSNKLDYFKKVIKLLNRIQLIKDTKVRNFKKKIYTIPKYNNQY
tara:strand:+ start:64 stop:453 length:390 start_codon:yes stop_codon:yes gene_type:complete